MPKASQLLGLKEIRSTPSLILKDLKEVDLPNSVQCQHHKEVLRYEPATSKSETQELLSCFMLVVIKTSSV